MMLAGIGTTVAGVHLTRLHAVAALDKATDVHRFVEIRGGPGVGKSAVFRQVAARVGQTPPSSFSIRSRRQPVAGSRSHRRSTFPVPLATSSMTWL